MITGDTQIKHIKKTMTARPKLFLIFVLLVCTLIPIATYAMSSETYAIPKDSINVGGGEGAASETYSSNDTMGEVGTGYSESETYGMDAGYRGSVLNPKLQFTLSGNGMDFGTLSQSAVSTGDITATVTTNAPGGYSATIKSDGDLKTSTGDIIPGVSDGSVTLGSAEYGFTTTGADGLFNATDTDITTTPKSFASNTSKVTNSATTVHFRASISADTKKGSYHQTITFIATGNF